MSTAEVRTSALSGWMDRMPEFGVDAAQAGWIAGIDAAQPAAARGMIPLSSFARMAEFVGDNASRANASWLIGEDYDLAELDEVGAAVRSAKTLGGALRRFTDNFELLQDASRLSLATTAETATVSYRILDPSIWPRHQDALFSLGIIAQIVKLAAPEAMQAMELGFECGKRNTGLSLCQSRLHFDCDANSITLPIAMLDLAMPACTNPCDLKGVSLRLAERRRGRPARERLAGIIFSRLAEGEINQDHLASEIGMSSRTMRRRLAQDDTSFQQLLDDCRMRQAVFEFQARPDASIAAIALRLGYAEHSTFTRAFTRWAGMPPHKFRAAQAVTRH